MTSVNSFFKLMREDIKHRLWVLILASVVFFFAFPIVTALVCENFSGDVARYFEYGNSAAIMKEKIINFYEGLGIILLIIAYVGACICGTSSFVYLQSKSQVDFYHSLPVRRERLFAVHYVDGVIFYILPYTLGMILSFVISSLHIGFYGPLVKLMLTSWLVGLMSFLAVYTVVSIAVVLTGKKLISNLGTLVFFFYADFIFGLISLYKHEFFSTYSGMGSFDEYSASTKWFSPLSYVLCLGKATYSDNEYERIALGTSFGQFIPYIIILVAIAFVLYKFRRSEKTGTAMVYKISEPIIRIGLTIPFALMFGIVFMTISEVADDFWLFFGMAIGTVIVHGAIEAFFTGDVRKCLGHKIQLLIEYVAAVLIALIFIFDVFGYDTYFPKEKNVSTISVDYDNFNVTSYPYYTSTYMGYNYLSDSLMYTEGTDQFKLIYNMAEAASKYNKKDDTDKAKSIFYNNGEECTLLSDYNGGTLTVDFYTKRGDRVWRSYKINEDENMQPYIAAIYDDVVLKKKFFEVFNIEKSNSEVKFRGLTILNFIGEENKDVY
ncbi:MAG: hypothetical protein K6B75_07505 [Lachnospiraceae bacterium]|nr:hypothetical protein [Lachnospiraceae bacterium]